MIRVFSAKDLQLVKAVCNFIQEHNISAFVSGENISQLAGALFNRTPDAWPSVWIHDESRLAEVKRLINEIEKRQQADQLSAQPLTEWICANCGEINYSTFEICWKCEKAR